MGSGIIGRFLEGTLTTELVMCRKRPALEQGWGDTDVITDHNARGWGRQRYDARGEIFLKGLQTRGLFVGDSPSTGGDTSPTLPKYGERGFGEGGFER